MWMKWYSRNKYKVAVIVKQKILSKLNILSITKDADFSGKIKTFSLFNDYNFSFVSTETLFENHLVINKFGLIILEIDSDYDNSLSFLNLIKDNGRLNVPDTNKVTNGN
jgi:hypothetical protein